MLAMTGNTATYMQYAYARVRSIFRRGQVDIESLRTFVVGNRARFTGRAGPWRGSCCGFSEALDMTVADYRPNQLTAYLFDLANAYSTFFEQCPVLKADTRRAAHQPAVLCDLTARTLKQGLELLGIPVIEKM